MLCRALLLSAEHSAPSVRARNPSSDTSTPATTSDPTLCGLATTSQPMLGCPARYGSCSILTFETSYRVISRVYQSTVSTNESKKFVPRTAGTRFVYTDTDRANEIFPAENEDEDTEATV
ncbi:hypothetical protein T03_15845 [Trichinella britovi]|uniref:Uncharacterized protein n=1 Tax=Trichinella britovi TaxID=45882 RepID=A0A0V1D230_TRIBR|nr:hypothetical protein T03_15845 [Trichinella britovi]